MIWPRWHDKAMPGVGHRLGDDKTGAGGDKAYRTIVERPGGCIFCCAALVDTIERAYRQKAARPARCCQGLDRLQQQHQGGDHGKKQPIAAQGTKQGLA